MVGGVIRHDDGWCAQFLAKQIKAAQTELMGIKDERVKVRSSHCLCIVSHSSHDTYIRLCRVRCDVSCRVCGDVSCGVCLSCGVM